MNIKVLATLGAILVFGAVSCAPQVSQPVTERERTAALGGLAGGAGGAVIGSMAGSALAGGLFGIPLGAVAGWYAGDQMAFAQDRDRRLLNERDAEIDRLRRENERMRRENDDIRRPRDTSQAPIDSTPERAASSNQATTSSQSTSSDQAVSSRQASGQAISSGQANQPDQIRQAQMALNKRGFNAGPQDGVWGPETESAIREFQKSRGLEVTGRLNDRTMKELGVAERSGERRATSGSSN
ncbi:MAG: peptidoglycan-binding domain-containing protein [Candidatus Binatia bacterium]